MAMQTDKLIFQAHYFVKEIKMQIKVGNKVLMTISLDDISCMENDLLSPRDWLKLALRGKINACKKRWFRTAIPMLRAKGLAIPSNDSDLIALVKTQPEYKNRKEREEEKNDVVDICLDSGKLAKSTCPLEKCEIQIFNKGTAPTNNCDVH